VVIIFVTLIPTWFNFFATNGLKSDNDKEFKMVIFVGQHFLPRLLAPWSKQRHKSAWRQFHP